MDVRLEVEPPVHVPVDAVIAGEQLQRLGRGADRQAGVVRTWRNEDRREMAQIPEHPVPIAVQPAAPGDVQWHVAREVCHRRGREDVEEPCAEQRCRALCDVGLNAGVVDRCCLEPVLLRRPDLSLGHLEHPLHDRGRPRRLHRPGHRRPPAPSACRRRCPADSRLRREIRIRDAKRRRPSRSGRVVDVDLPEDHAPVVHEVDLAEQALPDQRRPQRALVTVEPARSRT